MENPLSNDYEEEEPHFICTRCFGLPSAPHPAVSHIDSRPVSYALAYLVYDVSETWKRV
jgi:hypothetical protein